RALTNELNVVHSLRSQPLFLLSPRRRGPIATGSSARAETAMTMDPCLRGGGKNETDVAKRGSSGSPLARRSGLSLALGAAALDEDDRPDRGLVEEVKRDHQRDHADHVAWRDKGRNAGNADDCVAPALAQHGAADEPDAPKKRQQNRQLEADAERED